MVEDNLKAPTQLRQGAIKVLVQAGDYFVSQNNEALKLNQAGKTKEALETIMANAAFLHELLHFDESLLNQYEDPEEREKVREILVGYREHLKDVYQTH